MICKKNIQGEGRTVLFVDGGNKKIEFNCLAEYIKPGDIILAHDYVCTKEEFINDYKDKIWDWGEITEEGIEESCKKYNLQPFMEEILKKSSLVL